jgi:hypothetical protein
MPFHAAKDLVYTINGGNISSGGYRINKIINNGNKNKGNKQSGGRGGVHDMFNEDSGIPVGLLLLQRLPYNFNDDNEDQEKREHDGDKHKHKGNEVISKLIYANVMTDADNNDGHDNIELVVMPPTLKSLPLNESACSGIENPVEISSNEIDDDVYDFLVKNVSNPETMDISSLKPFRRATKKQHFGKHIEKVFQKRKTKSKRHEK